MTDNEDNRLDLLGVTNYTTDPTRPDQWMDVFCLASLSSVRPSVGALPDCDFVNAIF